jgi:hypothetical protein
MAEQKISALESRALAIKEAIGAEKAKLYNAIFDAPWEGFREAERIVQGTLSTNVDGDLRQQVFMREAEAASRAQRLALKEKIFELELEEQVQLAELEKQCREELTPDEVDTGAVISAASLTEEQIVQAADSIASAGDAASDTLLTLLSIAMERDYDLAVHHIAELRPEWETAVFDLGVCAESPSFDEDEIEARFEVMSPPESTPSGAAILEAAKSDLNVSASIRG